MWQQSKDQYYLQNGEWSICKVTLNGVTNYELWHKQVNCGYGFTSADEAKKRHLTTLNADNVIDD